MLFDIIVTQSNFIADPLCSSHSSLLLLSPPAIFLLLFNVYQMLPNLHLSFPIFERICSLLVCKDSHCQPISTQPYKEVYMLEPLIQSPSCTYSTRTARVSPTLHRHHVRMVLEYRVWGVKMVSGMSTQQWVYRHCWLGWEKRHVVPLPPPPPLPLLPWDQRYVITRK